jgi:CRP/FNR family transcriptional regulator
MQQHNHFDARTSLKSASPGANCASCRVRNTCLAKDLSPTDLQAFSEIVRHNRPLQRGDHVYWQGDRLESLYIVMSGSVKSYMVDVDGTEKVLGFYLPGEILGLDALDQGRHFSTATSLETTLVCELPYQTFYDLCARSPQLQQKLLACIGKELAREHYCLLTGQRSAELRLAQFLLDYSGRMKRLSLSATAFNLPMSRSELASFIGVASETVSRLIKRLQDEGTVDVTHRQIQIHDMQRLETMLGYQAVSPKAIH